MPFPAGDKFWIDTLRFLQENARPLEAVFAPTEFLDVFPGAYDYHVDKVLPVDHFKFFVFHKGILNYILPEFLLRVVRESTPVFANEVFVVTQRRGTAPIEPRCAPPEQHVRSFLALVAGVEAQPVKPPPPGGTAVFVMTYNRPWALERSLPQLVATGKPVLVVDDGSDAPHRDANRDLARRHGALYLVHPENRGAACALNSGLGYWLADPSVEWISCFQDDVDVRRNLFDVFAKVQDATLRPFLTGRFAPEHGLLAKETVAGIEVYLQRSCAGVHKHAHREHWRRLMPIPTWYLGAPKPGGGRRGEGSNADWWITSWSPRCVVKQGLHIVCVPGLVRHFAHEADASTWHRSASYKPDPEF